MPRSAARLRQLQRLVRQQARESQSMLENAIVDAERHGSPRARTPDRNTPTGGVVTCVPSG